MRTLKIVAGILLLAIGILGSLYGYSAGWPDIVSDMFFLVCLLLVFGVRSYKRQ